MNNTYLPAESSRIDIPADRAVSVHVAVGTQIQCMLGNVWLTQHSDHRDHCFSAGLTFCIDKPGQAVITSIHGAAVVLVRNPESCAVAGLVPGTMRIDSLEQLTRAAAQARADYVAGVIARLIRRAVAGSRRLRQIGSALTRTVRNA
jgi:hypothetical protein